MNGEPLEMPAAKNINTILLTIALAVMSFVGVTSFNNSVGIGEIKAAQITRPELETRLSELRSEQNRQSERITMMQLQLAKFIKANEP